MPYPGPRAHGAAELHGATCVPDAATSGRLRRARALAQQTAAQGHRPAARRRSRSTRSTWAADSDGAAAADYVGEAVEVSKACRRAGETDVVARRRFAAGYSIVRLPTREVRRRAGCRWLAARTLQPHRLPAVRRRAQRLSRTGVEGIAGHAVRDSATCWWIITPSSRDPGELLAVGGLLAEHLLRGKLPRRDGGGGQQGSGGGAPPAAGEIAAHARCAGTGGRKVRLGQAACRPDARAAFRVVNNIGSFTAQVAEVSVTRGKLKVHRVVCAVDCGRVVNPAILEQQIQSGIVFGLAAALKGGITIDRGRVQQSNFQQYDVLRIDEMPVVEVHIVHSQNASGGAGEASTPGIAPAVCNAIFKATGKRIRRLPIRKEDLA